MKKMNYQKKFLSIALLFISLSGHAQYLRTSYFMEGASSRMQLNPALRPSRGYISIPVLGSLNAAVSSNAMGTNDISNCFDSDGKFYNSDKFYNRLKTNNQLNIGLNTDIISFGFFNGKGFWSFNLGARMDLDASIPKSMFDFLRSTSSENFSWSNTDFNIRNQQLKLNAYTEIGLGYSRAINKRLSVGGRVKMLLGAANLNMQINEISITSHNIPEDWRDPNGATLPDASASIKTDAYIESSISGIDLSESIETATGRPYIDEVNFNKFGIGGYGMGIDLGASYQLTEKLNVSGAILDLGFISWSKDSFTGATSKREVVYDKNSASDFYNRTEGNEVFDFDLIGLEKTEEKKSRSTSLASSLVLGAEYALIGNKLTIGALSTTRFGQIRTQSELTISGNYRPNTLIGLSASYSMIQSAGKSFGLAFRIGTLMIGTDYMYLGENSKCINAFIGLSIPLSKQKKS